MKARMLKYQIKALRQDKIIWVLHSIAMFMFSLFISLFLPQILYRYYFANQQLTEQPPILELIPVIAFAVGVAFFLYVMIANAMRGMKIRRLEREFMSMDMDACCAGCDGNCNCSDHGGCECGCETMGMGSMSSDSTPAAMAEKMKSMSRKRRVSKK